MTFSYVTKLWRGNIHVSKNYVFHRYHYPKTSKIPTWNRWWEVYSTAFLSISLSATMRPGNGVSLCEKQKTGGGSGGLVCRSRVDVSQCWRDQRSGRTPPIASFSASKITSRTTNNGSWFQFPALSTILSHSPLSSIVCTLISPLGLLHRSRMVAIHRPVARGGVRGVVTPWNGLSLHYIEWSCSPFTLRFSDFEINHL